MIILLVIFILQIPQLLNNFIQILIFFIDKNYFAFVLLYHFILFFQSLGCAIYTGPDTKMALNSKAKITKFSRVERYCIVIIDSYII